MYGLMFFVKMVSISLLDLFINLLYDLSCFLIIIFVFMFNFILFNNFFEIVMFNVFIELFNFIIFKLNV